MSIWDVTPTGVGGWRKTRVGRETECSRKKDCQDNDPRILGGHTHYVNSGKRVCAPCYEAMLTNHELTIPTYWQEKMAVQRIGRQILMNTTFAVHVFQTIWDAQQEFEKFTGQYGGSDDQGFQPYETAKWNRFYDMAEQSGWRFTPEEVDRLREGMWKYRKQFRRLTRAQGG